MNLSFKLHSLQIQFDDATLYEEINRESISILFEIQQLESSIHIHADQENIGIIFSIKKLEIS